MARENPYFFISGFISLILFMLVISLFFIMMLSASKTNSYALKKDDFISVSLEIVNIPTKKRKKEAIAVQEESQVIEEVKEVDIGNLFSDVWAKDIKIKKQKIKKVDNKRFELMKKKIKTSKNNKENSLVKNIDNTQATVRDSKSQKSSSANEVNEYLAKIQAIVYKYFKPPSNSQGHTVKAVIELSAIGKVQDFRILTYSSNQALNQECDKIKLRIITALFPSNPENKSSKTIVNITSDKN